MPLHKNHSAVLDWLDHPFQEEHWYLPGKSRTYHRERLFKDSTRIFEPEENDFGYNGIIPQKYSWGQLSITQEACQKILSWHHVFVSFIDVIHSFGFKKSANDDILRCQSYHGYLSTGLNPRQPYLYGISVPSQLSYSRLKPISELCYIVQYVEKNGRDRGDPWSLRQTGVYEQVDIETGKSVWIILQPSSSARQCLEQGLQTLDQDTYGRNTSDPMLLHSIFLLATADNWVEYIKHLHSQADEMVS